MKDATFPVLLIVLGAAWLLSSLHWLPEVHWIWILGLAGAGLAILMLDGITKSSIVAGPLLILAGALSFFHQYYLLGWRFMIPIMLIAIGLFMLIARSPSIHESRRLKRRSSTGAEAPKQGDTQGKTAYGRRARRRASLGQRHSAVHDAVHRQQKKPQKQAGST